MFGSPLVPARMFFSISAACTSLAGREVFNPKTVIELRERLLRERSDMLIWRVASAEAWFQTMIDGPSRSGLPAAEISALKW